MIIKFPWTGKPWFCRISEFGSINKREFATRIVAKRQNVVFFSGGNCKFPNSSKAEFGNSA